MRYLSILREQRHPVRFLASRVLMRSGLSRRLVIDCGAFRLRFFPTSLTAHYWIDPGGRRHDHDFVRRYLRPGETMVDVGANVGALTLAGSLAVGDAGRVVAIEAHPRTFGYLEANVALNGRGNVRTLNFAVGAGAGTIHFSDQRSDDQNAVVQGGGLTVRLQTLDGLLEAEPGPVHLLKVDVEGFEREVFRGAARVLARTRCVYFESWERAFGRYGYGTPEVLRMLRDQGLQVFRAEAGGLRPLPDGYVSSSCENLLALRDPADYARRIAGAAPG